MDSSYIPKHKELNRKNFFSKIGGHSFEGTYTGMHSDGRSVGYQYATAGSQVDMGQDRFSMARAKYQHLQKRSYEVPLNKEKATVPRWLQQKLLNRDGNFIDRLYRPKQRNPLQLVKNKEQDMKPLSRQKKDKKQEIIEKRYDVRNIFVLMDGQDILAKDLQFSYVEINDRLSKFVPDKVWKSQAAQRLTLNQKIELSLPSQAMQEQSMLEILDEVSQKMGKQFETAYLLSGEQMLSPLDLPIEARILVASTTTEFKGLTGLENFESYNNLMRTNKSHVGAATFINQVNMPSVKVKPQPQTWVHMAQTKWCQQNATTNVASLNDAGANDVETQNKII